MPRQGDGSSDNGPVADNVQTLAHGANADGSGDHLARTEKVAPMPEPEKGQGLSDANASGGQSQGIKKGDNVGQGN